MITRILVLMMLATCLCTCSQSSQHPTKEVRIHHFSNAQLYVGTVSLGFSDAETIQAHYPDYPKTTVFWRINGITGKVNLAPGNAVYDALWSSATRQITVLATKGVYTIEPNAQNTSPVWTDELLSPPYAIEPTGRSALVTGFDADKQKSFLLLIDLTRLAHTRFYAEAYPTGAAFLDPNNAIVSTKTHLLTLRRDSEGVWECTVSPNVKSANAVGALGGLPLYRRDEVLYWGDNTVRCPDRLARVGVGNTTLVLITSSGAVYYLHTDRTLRKAAGLQMCDLVGCGTYSKGVWIAMKNGRVHTFSLGGREEDYDISLKWIDP